MEKLHSKVGSNFIKMVKGEYHKSPPTLTEKKMNKNKMKKRLLKTFEEYFSNREIWKEEDVQQYRKEFSINELNDGSLEIFFKYGSFLYDWISMDMIAIRPDYGFIKLREIFRLENGYYFEQGGLNNFIIMEVLDYDSISSGVI